MRQLIRMGWMAMVLVLTAGLARATIDINLQMQLGNPSNATVDPNNHSHYLLQRAQYALDYNDTLGEPNWVSWDLTSGDVGSSGRSNAFSPDPALPSTFYAVTTTDYNGVGAIDFNRGHMCPSEDRTDNLTDNLAVFYMTNIVPQSAENNQGPWELFEDYCRNQAGSGYEVLITSGPSDFSGGASLPSGKVRIPGYTWKIATFVPTAGGGTAIARINSVGAANIRVVAIKIPNLAGIQSDPWQKYITTVAQISSDTGLTFFTNASIDGATLRSKPADGTVATGLPIISVQPVSQTAAVNGSASFSVTATDGGNPPLSYQWFKEDTALVGQTSATLTLTNLQAADADTYSVTITNSVGSTTSNAAALVVTGLPPAVTIQPVPVTVNAGESPSFSVVATGSPPLSYQWRKNGTAITGNATATTALLALTNVQAADAGNYDVVITNSATSVTSNAAALAVTPAGPTIVTPPAPQTVTGGSTATFTVSVKGTSGFTYQWLKNNAAITGNPSALTSSLSITNVASGDVASYSVTVSNGVGSPVTSNAAPLTIGNGFSTGTVIVQRDGDGTTALSAAAAQVNLVAYGSDGSVVGTPHSLYFSSTLPTAAPFNVTAAGSATDDGFLSLSSNGLLVTVPGYNAVAGAAAIASSTSASNPRSIGVIVSSGTVSAPLAVPTLFSAANFRGVVSDGTSYWATGSTGVAYITAAGAVTSLNTANSRAIGIFNNTLYGSTGSSAAAGGGALGIFSVGTPGTLPTTAANGVTAIATGSNSSPGQFAISPDGAWAYVADDGSPTSAVGGIQKWHKVSGTWSLQYRLGGVSARGLAVDFTNFNGTTGLGAAFYATTTETSNNKLYYCSSDNGSTTTGVVIANAGTNLVFRGLALAPKSPAPVLPAVSSVTPANASNTASSLTPIVVTFNQAVTVSPGWYAINSAATGPITASVTASSDLTSYTFNPGAPFTPGDTITVKFLAANVADQATGSLHPTSDYTFSFSTVAPVAPSIASAPVAATALAGANATFTVVAGGTPPFTYQWMKNGVALTDGGNVAGSGTATLTLTGVQAGDASNYEVKISNGTAPAVTSTPVSLTVTSVAPMIVTAPVPTQANTGGNATFTVASGGSTPFSYQWYKGTTALTNGGTISGATSATLTITGVAAADAGNYSVVISNGVGSPAATTPVALTVVVAQVAYAGTVYTQNFDTLPAAGSFTLAGPGPFLLNDPAGVNAPGLAGWSFAKFAGTGTNALFTVDNGSGISGSIYSYGSTSSTDRALGSVASNATTERFGLTLVNTTSQIINQFQLTYTGEEWRNGGSGSANTLEFAYSLGATDINTGTFTLVPALNFVTPTDSTTAAALDGNASANRTVGITATITGLNWLPGQTLILRWSDFNDVGSDDGFAIDDLTFVAVNPPALVASPVSVRAVSGNSVSFTAAGSGSGLTYQWMLNGAPITGNPTATAATLVIPVAREAMAGAYTCVISTLGGSVTSAPATLTLLQAGATVTLGNLTQTYTGSPLAVTTATSPAGLKVVVAYNGSLTAPSAAGSYPVTATISDPDYAGSASGTLVIQAAATTGGGAPSVSSPTITASPTGYTGTAGTPVTLTVAATTGGGTLTYQWSKNGAPIAGATGPSLTLTGAVSESGSYTVAVINSAGSVTTPAVTVAITAAVAAPPQAPAITAQPLAATAQVGGSITFSVAATGTPAPTYQWRKDGVAIAGATSATLTLTNLAATDAAGYSVIVTNASGSAASSLAVLTVTTTATAPVITHQPGSFTLAVGAAVTLTVQAEGSPLPTYQWKLNGVAIAGATSSTYVLPSLSMAQAGTYTVVVTNSAGSVTSNPAIAVVLPVSYAGTYFGTLSNGGSFAIQIGGDNTGIFLGFAPGSGTAYVSRAVTVDNSGHFSFTTTITTSGSAASGALISSPQPQAIVADATSAASFTGTIGSDGSLTGSGNGLTLTATKSASGSTAAVSGFYQANAAGSSSSTLAIISPSGQAFVLTQTGATIDGGTGTIDSSGNASLTTAGGRKVSITVSANQFTATTNSASGATVTYSAVSNTTASTATQRVLNLSSRAQVGPGPQTASAGFVIAGVESKPVLIRAVGPTLGSFGIASPLAAPQLDIYNSSGGKVATNTGWKTGSNVSLVSSIMAATANAGAFPLSAAGDSALMLTLAPGAYTAVVSSSDGTTGVVMVEFYDLAGASPDQKLVNLSTRAVAGAGANALVAGVVVSGTAPQRVLVRAAGPGLTPFGVTGVLAHPLLTLYSGSTVVAQNSGWSTSADVAAITDAIARTGAFPFTPGSADAAIIINLAPGSYTAQVTGADGGTGMTLVEIYTVP